MEKPGSKTDKSVAGRKSPASVSPCSRPRGMATEQQLPTEDVLLLFLPRKSKEKPFKTRQLLHSVVCVGVLRSWRNSNLHPSHERARAWEGEEGDWVHTKFTSTKNANGTGGSQTRG